jgi:response regulator RpfG family c-di-GMP phosphodiesterase
VRLDIDRNLLKSLMVMGTVIEARDAYTGGHLWRVGQYSRLLAERAGLSGYEEFLASVGGFLHDLGKIGVPDAILQKPDKLTEREYAVIKTHPAVGRDLIREHPLGDIVVDAIAQHHERPDGLGYPYGLAAEAIAPVAKVVGIADAFDAMTSTRPYRRGMAAGKALAVLAAEKGRQFDDSLVERFLEIARAGRLDHVIGHSDHGQRLAECPVCGPIVVVPKATRDGEEINCRVCTGSFRLHRKVDAFELELLDRKATPAELQVRPDLAAIDSFLADAA